MSDNASSANVWIYARKSRHLGDPDDEGIVDHQVSRLQRIATERGLPPPVVIREIGSAETIAGRPRFAALLEAWERLPPSVGGWVLVTEPERLSRGTLVERGRIAEALARADARIVTPSRVYNLRDPDDEMWFAFTSSLGRRELAVYKQRAKAKVEELLREGAVRNGKAPWGYVWSKDAKTLLPHAERFDALRRICRDALTISVKRLAEREGVGISTLTYTLHNPAICGWPVIHTQAGRKGQCWLPRSEWRWPEQQNDTYPHACTRAEWETIQQALEERNNRRGKTIGANGWCRDVVRFVDVDACVGLGGNAGGVPSYAAFRNNSRVAGVQREIVHQAALAALERALGDPIAALALIRAAIAATATPPSDASPQETLAELRRRYQRTVDAEFDAEEPLRAALAARRHRLEEELRRAERAARAAVAHPRADPAALAAIQRVLDPALSITEQWPLLAEEQRRALVNACIAEIQCRARDPRGRRLVGAARLVGVVLQPWFAHLQG